MKSPLTFKDYSNRGYSIERAFLVIFEPDHHGFPFHPWAAYSIEVEEHIDGPSPEVRKGQIIHYSEWAFERCKRDSKTFYYSPGGGGGLPKFSDIIRSPCHAWLDACALDGYHVGNQWQEQGKADCLRQLELFRKPPQIDGVTHWIPIPS